MSSSGEGQLFGRTPEELLGMPLDELALLVLDDASQGWNVRNWFSMKQQDRSLPPRGPLPNRLAEAWQWLFNHGLVARDWYDESSSDAYKMTSVGQQLLADREAGLSRLKATQRLGVELHPRLAATVQRQFLLGDYELAAFAALREVEVAVRERSGASATELGVGLIRAAFKPNEGPLSGDRLVSAEQQARSDLFAGAIGFFKNPPSHRPVDYENPTVAAEVVLLADLLLRLLDRIPPGDQEGTPEDS